MISNTVTSSAASRLSGAGSAEETLRGSEAGGETLAPRPRTQHAAGGPLPRYSPVREVPVPTIRDQTILITGASSGLGHGLALALAGHHNRFVLTARRKERLDALAAQLEARGSQALVVPADALDRDACENVLQQAISTFGHIDVAVLNAGGGTAMSMSTATTEQVLGIMRLNYDTVVHFLCPLIAHMKPRGQGLLAVTGSPAGFFGLPKSGPYSAAKAAVRLLIDTCRIELAGTGIDLVALYPGFTHTDALDPEDVPTKALIIDVDRAVAEMKWALERRRSHHLFPNRIAWLITLARWLPEPVRRFILRRAGG